METAKVGLALGAGSARGWSHIGVIEALLEAGVTFDVVCGTSIGALVGAALISGQLPALKEWALSLTWRQMVAMLDVRLNGGGLINGKAIVRKLIEMGVNRPIEDYDIPYAAVAAELSTGHEVWIREGRIDEAVRASISLPGIVSPAKIDGRWLLDGGLVNPVPVSACRALGADVIIAVNLNADFFEARGSRTAAIHTRRLRPKTRDKVVSLLPKDGPADAALRLLRPHDSAPGYLDVLVTAFSIMQDQITRSRLAGEPPQVLIIPQMAGIGPMDFHRAGDAIERGRAAVAHLLPTLHRAVKAS